VICSDGLKTQDLNDDIVRDLVPHLLVFCAVDADDHDIVPDLPVLVIALDGLLEYLPGPGLFS
jgi:hypothetical protein